MRYVSQHKVHAYNYSTDEYKSKVPINIYCFLITSIELLPRFQSFNESNRVVYGPGIKNTPGGKTTTLEERNFTFLEALLGAHMLVKHKGQKPITRKEAAEF